MAHLKILTERCQDYRCTKTASYEVVGREGDSFGCYCGAHAPSKLAIANMNERRQLVKAKT